MVFSSLYAGITAVVFWLELSVIYRFLVHPGCVPS